MLGTVEDNFDPCETQLPKSQESEIQYQVNIFIRTKPMNSKF